MTLDQFESFVEQPHIEWAEDEENFLFRDTRLDYYSNNPGNATKVAKTLVGDMTVEDLEKEITRGLKVEHISRVTGYFAKINSWNAGKKAELRDRYKSSIEG